MSQAVNSRTYILPKQQLVLGLLGLIPFVVLSITIVFFDANIAGFSAKEVLEMYSFGILSFLCGSWWRPAELKSAATALSNLLFLVGFFAFILLKPYVLFIFSILFVAVYLVEHHTTAVGEFAPAYKKLRLVLTVVVSTSLLFAGLAYKNIL